MDQQRLFHVAPEAVHLVVSHDPFTSTWRVRASRTVRLDSGEFSTDSGTAYEHLTASEALDVAAAVLAGELGL